jgi:hypothetical protein
VIFNVLEEEWKKLDPVYFFDLLRACREGVKPLLDPKVFLLNVKNIYNSLIIQKEIISYQVVVLTFYTND